VSKLQSVSALGEAPVHQENSLAPLATVPELIEEIRAGRMVILVDDEDRENEGDLLMAADAVTPAAINFMAKYGRGLICLTLTEQRSRELNLPIMVQSNGTQYGTNFTVSIEAATGVTTGISAADRARTVQVAVDRNSTATDLVQPGHIFPIVAQPGGVLMRAGHTEAGCDLAALAGRTPASVICEILKDDGEMARLPDLRVFAKEHGLKLGTIADLIQYRSAHESLVSRLGSRPVKTPWGEFTLTLYRDSTTHQAHMSLSRGAIRPDQETLVRVHEPFLPLDWFEESGAHVHSWPLPRAMTAVAGAPCGVVVLLNCTESAATLFGRMEDFFGRDPATPAPVARAANHDLRTYGIGAQILKDLGVGKMRLLAMPRKMPSMAGFDLETVGFESGN
jgi:3,4-dihydroxy 2-butanone 4-phosphate synthase / GTP cyclohydrolase II